MVSMVHMAHMAHQRDLGTIPTLHQYCSVVDPRHVMYGSCSCPTVSTLDSAERHNNRELRDTELKQTTLHLPSSVQCAEKEEYLQSFRFSEVHTNSRNVAIILVIQSYLVCRDEQCRQHIHKTCTQVDIICIGTRGTTACYYNKIPNIEGQVQQTITPQARYIHEYFVDVGSSRPDIFVVTNKPLVYFMTLRAVGIVNQ